MMTYLNCFDYFKLEYKELDYFKLEYKKLDC